MSERGLTPVGSIRASGYHTPDNQTTRSSSPDSSSVGSFHTAHPIDSERSSPWLNTDIEGWETPQPEHLSSLEVPSLEGDNTLLVEGIRDHLLPPPASDEEKEEEEVTLRQHPTPPRSMMEYPRERGATEGEVRNWIGQPKLIPADSDTVPPCPEKRPLTDNSVAASRNHSNESIIRETTPLLRSTASSTRSGARECDCCVLL